VGLVEVVQCNSRAEKKVIVRRASNAAAHSKACYRVEEVGIVLLFALAESLPIQHRFRANHITACLSVASGAASLKAEFIAAIYAGGIGLSHKNEDL